MGYRYETHLHTCQGSGCGRSTGAEHARFYKDAGYQGIFVTDHFFRGNTAVRRDQPWADRVAQFCSGFEDAWNEGQKIGLDVFFGWEENFQGDEYLIYGLDKQFLLDHPEMERWTHRQQFDAIHASGGCIIQAHPFRMRGYLNAIRVAEGYADGVEVTNAGNTPAQDAYAWRYAHARGLYMTAGSDNHRSTPEQPLFAVELAQPLVTSADWVRHVLAREPHILVCDESRFTADVAQEPLIDSFWLDETETYRPLPMDWLN